MRISFRPRTAWSPRARRLAMPVLTFGATLVFGGMAVLGTRGYIEQRVATERARLQPEVATVDVIVAKRDLSRGDVVDGDTVAVRAMPADLVPGPAVRAEGFDRVDGTRLGVDMRAGEPLLSSSVQGGDGLGFASTLRSGVRALTVSVDEVNSLSGMLQPGDRIDLLLSARRAGSQGDADVTVPLMQDVPVLATGRQVRAAPEPGESAGRGFTAITIEVTPGQAQRLVVAQRAGRLTAMLRNPEDKGTLDRAALDIDTLLGVPPAPARRAGLEVIVGGMAGEPERRTQELPTQPEGLRNLLSTLAGMAPGARADAQSAPRPTDAAPRGAVDAQRAARTVPAPDNLVR